MPSLEDDLSDIIRKAQRGHRLPDSELCRRADITREALNSVRAGARKHLPALAQALGLGARALADIAGGWAPQQVSLPGLVQAPEAFPQHGPEASVNGWLLHLPESKRAVLFDAGTSGKEILAAIERRGLELAALVITHAHGDHTGGLELLRRAYAEASVYAPARGRVCGATPIEAGWQSTLAGLHLSAHATPGHTADGLTYRVEGLARPVAVVGDALFAGSVGGIPEEAYASGLEAIRREILALAQETVLCPGHGPATTVAEEREHNAFFAR